MSHTTALPNVLTASDARSNLYEILGQVKKNLRRFVITHHGIPQAVVISIEDLESWEETLEILSNKKLMRDIHQAQKDRKAGRVYSLEEVENILKLHEG